MLTGDSEGGSSGGAFFGSGDSYGAGSLSGVVYVTTGDSLSGEWGVTGVGDLSGG